MKKKSYLIYLLLAAMLVLSACGSTANDGKTTGDGPDEGGAMTEDESNDQGIENEEEEEANDSDQEAEDENDTALEEFLKNTEMVDSDAQEFSMHILPEYTLTSEEPGRDSLYLTEDGLIFMRVETMPFDQETYDFWKENTTELLTASALDDESVKEITDASLLPQGENIKNAVGYSVSGEESYMTGIVFENDGMVIRLTIFDTLDQEYLTDFLQMGATIQSK